MVEDQCTLVKGCMSVVLLTSDIETCKVSVDNHFFSVNLCISLVTGLNVLSNL